MSASKLICYISSHPAAFRLWSSTPPDNTTLTPANRKADQNLSEFQTAIGSAAHATLETEHLISHLEVALVNTLSSLPNSEGGIIPVPEVHELLPKAHDILDNAVFKWVQNSACILAYVFNSVSRQCHEIWASQFPLIHSLKYVIPPSEACLYGHINWSLTQAQQQSSIGLSSSFPCKRGSKARPWPALHFTVQKRAVPGSSLWQRGLTLRVGLRLIQVARILLVAVSMPVLLILGGRELWGSALLMCFSPQPPYHLHMQFFRLVCFFNFLVQCCVTQIS